MKRARRNTAKATITDGSGKPQQIPIHDGKERSREESSKVSAAEAPKELSFHLTFNVDKFAENFAQAAADAVASKSFRRRYGRDPSPAELTEFHRRALE